MFDADDLHKETVDEETIPNPSQDEPADQVGAGETDDERLLSLARRQAMARSVVAAFAAASAAATTIPLPFKDAVMLSPIELAEVSALARVFDIPQEESARRLVDAILELGVISMAARGAIGVVDKTIKIGVTSKIKSAVIAATIVAGIGACTTYLFEQVYLGHRSIDELGFYQRRKWVEDWQEAQAQSPLANSLREAIGEGTFDGIMVSITELLKTLVPIA